MKHKQLHTLTDDAPRRAKVTTSAGLIQGALRETACFRRMLTEWAEEGCNRSFGGEARTCRYGDDAEELRDIPMSEWCAQCRAEYILECAGRQISER